MRQPEDIALHPNCGFDPPCASQQEMRERHGTPEEFVAAVYSCPDISGREAEIASGEYRRAYETAALADLVVTEEEIDDALVAVRWPLDADGQPIGLRRRS